MAIQSSRIQTLNQAAPTASGAYVLYWMQNAQRAAFNPALEFAIEQANDLGVPTLVCFGLTETYPEANARHYTFLLEGLADIERALTKRGIGFVVRLGSPDEVALHYAKHARLVVADRGYLKIQRLWRSRVTKEIDRRLVQVEGDVVVPIETASDKHEYGARTIRPKLHRVWDEYLQPLAPRRVKHRADDLKVSGDIDLSAPAKIVAKLKIDQTVGAVRRFKGGQTEARRRLEAYLAGPFARYEEERNKPEAGAASYMSPYLHLGQISPVEIALKVREAKAGGAGDKASYLEELIVRRELGMNHCFYDARYDAYEAAPDWARASLAQHANDKRPFHYTSAQFEEGKTHDRFWNGAMKEMRETGYMHNQLRMYWGKKFIEWTKSPEEAFDLALKINNKYFLDGRDANSFTNIAWLFGLHDRPWVKRPIFGTVRYLNENSLKKFNAKAYLWSVDKLADEERA